MADVHGNFTQHITTKKGGEWWEIRPPKKYPNQFRLINIVSLDSIFLLLHGRCRGKGEDGKLKANNEVEDRYAGVIWAWEKGEIWVYLSYFSFMKI